VNDVSAGTLGTGTAPAEGSSSSGVGAGSRLVSVSSSPPACSTVLKDCDIRSDVLLVTEVVLCLVVMAEP
jgi:hypothetical protein